MGTIGAAEDWFPSVSISKIRSGRPVATVGAAHALQALGRRSLQAVDTVLQGHSWRPPSVLAARRASNCSTRSTTSNSMCLYRLVKDRGRRTDL